MNLKHTVYTGSYKKKIYWNTTLNNKRYKYKHFDSTARLLLSKNIEIIATCIVLTTKRPLCLEKCIFPFELDFFHCHGCKMIKFRKHWNAKAFAQIHVLLTLFCFYHFMKNWFETIFFLYIETAIYQAL